MAQILSYEAEEAIRWEKVTNRKQEKREGNENALKNEHEGMVICPQSVRDTEGINGVGREWQPTTYPS